MKLTVEVDTPDQGDARVIAEGVFRLAQCAAEGTPVEVAVNGRVVRVVLGDEWRDRLPRRRAWQVNEPTSNGTRVDVLGPDLPVEVPKEA